MSERPDNATILVRAREPHVEVIDPATRDVWQSLEPMSADVYRALALDPGLARVGIGTGAMDEHWFERSPGAAEAGPMEERKIDGHRFGLCARPIGAPELPGGPDGPRQLQVDKHHVLRFEAGRRIPILHLPEGHDFIHTIDGGPDKAPLTLPDGWEIREQSIESDWVVKLPAPATVFFFPNGDSFQGPFDRLAPTDRSSRPGENP